MTRHSSDPQVDRISLALAAAILCVSSMQSLVSPALPTLQAELGTSQNGAAWIVIGFLLSSAISAPILGRLGDMTGKVRALMIALVATIIGNLISAAALGIEQMVVGRAIQGVGMAAFPLAFGIIRDEYAPARVSSAVAMMSSTSAIGAGLGAILAGPIASLIGWRWLFLLPTIALVLCALFVWRWIPETRERPGGRLNLVAALMLAIWLVALLLPLSQATRWGWLSAPVLSLLFAAFVAGIAWVLIEARSTNPLIDMRIMRARGVWTNNVVAFLFGSAMFSVWTFLPQFVQADPADGYGFGATVSQAGWTLLPMLVTMAIAGALVGRLEARFSLVSQLSGGAAFVALGCAGFAFFHGELWQVCAASGIFGIGLGFAFATMPILMVRSVPPQQTGIATGMNANIRTIGGAIGATVMTTIVTTYRGPDGLPSEHGFILGFAVFAGVALLAMIFCRLLPRAS